jgi:hypothetical protein
MYNRASTVFRSSSLKKIITEAEQTYPILGIWVKEKQEGKSLGRYLIDHL